MTRPRARAFAFVVVAAASLVGCDGDSAGGIGAGGSGAGGDGTGGEDIACFGDAPAGADADFVCGGAGLTCRADQACVRFDHALTEGTTHEACPEPAGCATPPDDICWIHECHDLPPDCGRDCSCIEPHLQYASHPAATCSDDDGHVWIDGSPVVEQPPWRDACFGACSGDERCWLCGPAGGCMADSEDPACQPATRCSVDDPSGYPHPTCFEQPLL